MVLLRAIQINRRHLAPKKRRPLAVIDLPPQQQKMLRQKRRRLDSVCSFKKGCRGCIVGPATDEEPPAEWELESSAEPAEDVARTGHRSVVVRIVMAWASVMVNASNAMGNATDNAKTACEMQMGKAEIGVDAAVAKAADLMKPAGRRS